LKNFIIVNGAMGVGKTSICKELNKKLVNSAWLDGDWCMMMNPFTEANQKIFLDNIYYLLNNYLSHPTFEYVLFSWLIPREDMMNYMIKKLSDNDFRLIRVTLLCADDKLRERMLRTGRDELTIEKSMLYQETFKNSNTTEKVDTTELSLGETADEVLRIIKRSCGT
jgi:broad-specificity NMP kinase